MTDTSLATDSSVPTVSAVPAAIETACASSPVLNDDTDTSRSDTVHTVHTPKPLTTDDCVEQLTQCSASDQLTPKQLTQDTNNRGEHTPDSHDVSASTSFISNMDVTLSPPVQKPESKKPNVVYVVKSPKQIRRSTRPKPKRKRADEWGEEVALAEGLSDLEYKFNQRIDRLEERFSTMLTSFITKTDTKTAKSMHDVKLLVEGLQQKMVTEIESKVDVAVNNKTAALQQQIVENKACLTEIEANQQRIISEEVQSQIASLPKEIDADTSASVDVIQKQLDDITTQLHDHAKTFNEHNKKFETLELHSRKLNLVFEGVPLREGESCKQVIEHLIHRMLRSDNRVYVDIAHTLSDKPNAPIIARFRSVSKKSRVLENSLPLRKQGIFVRPDLPASISEKGAS